MYSFVWRPIGWTNWLCTFTCVHYINLYYWVHYINISFAWLLMHFQFRPSLGPAGSHEVLVIAGQNGKARHQPDTLNFTYEFSVTGISPTQGSIAGKIMLDLRYDTIDYTRRIIHCYATACSYLCIYVLSQYVSNLTMHLFRHIFITKIQKLVGRIPTFSNYKTAKIISVHAHCKAYLYWTLCQCFILVHDRHNSVIFVVCCVQEAPVWLFLAVVLAPPWLWLWEEIHVIYWRHSTISWFA